MTIELPEVFEENGPRGGQYYFVKLSDGRRLHVSRKTGDQRVWLGRPDDAGSYMDQRGGIGSIKGFMGSRPFCRTNHALLAEGISPIDWDLS